MHSVKKHSFPSVPHPWSVCFMYMKISDTWYPSCSRQALGFWETDVLGLHHLSLGFCSLMGKAVSASMKRWLYFNSAFSFSSTSVSIAQWIFCLFIATERWDGDSFYITFLLHRVSLKFNVLWVKMWKPGVCWQQNPFSFSQSTLPKLLAEKTNKSSEREPFIVHKQWLSP